MTTPSSERRRAPRVAASFPVRLTDRSDAPSGRMRDLSEIGLCCTYPEPIDEMTQVRIGLQLPGDERVLEVEGAVVRCEPVEDAGHEVAVYFTAVPEASRAALRGWIAGQPVLR